MKIQQRLLSLSKDLRATALEEAVQRGELTAAEAKRVATTLQIPEWAGTQRYGTTDRAADFGAKRLPATSPLLVRSEKQGLSSPARAPGPLTTLVRALAARVAATGPALPASTALATWQKQYDAPGMTVLTAQFMAFGAGVTPEPAVIHAPGVDPRLQAARRGLDDASLPTLLAHLGPASLPFLLDHPWRAEHVVSRWNLSESDAELVYGAFVSGPRDVAKNVTNALLENSSLGGSFKRRILLATLDGAAKLPPDVSASALLLRLAASREPSERVMAAEVLDNSLYGTHELSKAQRQGIIRSLLADANLDVRVAAAPLFWDAAFASTDVQQKQSEFLSIVNHPLVQEDARFESIMSMGWSRESAHLWAPNPKGMSERLVNAHVEMLGRILERAPKDADISKLLESLSSIRDAPKAKELSFSKIEQSTSMSLPAKAAAMVALASRDSLQPEMTAAVLRFAAAQPKVAAEGLQPIMNWLVHLTHARDQPLTPSDIERWRDHVSTAGGIPIALAMIRESQNPGIRPAIDTRQREKILLDFAASVEAEPGTIRDAFDFESAVRTLAEPGTSVETFRATLPALVRFAFGSAYQLSASAERDCVHLLADRRLQPNVAIDLVAQLLKTADRRGVWRLTDVLERAGIPRALLAQLEAARPELLSFAPSSHVDTARLTPRAETMRAAVRNNANLDRETFETGVIAFLKSMSGQDVRSMDDVGKMWPAAKAAFRWNDGISPEAATSAPHITEMLNDVRGGTGYDEFANKWREKAPLNWSIADEIRSRSGEKEALQHLLTHEPKASPLWRGALRDFVAVSPHLSETFKQRVLLDALQSGYLSNTSLDESWDALSSMVSMPTATLDFAGSALVGFARLHTTTKDFFALGNFLEDRRLSPGVVSDVLLTSIDRAFRPINSATSFLRDIRGDVVLFVSRVLEMRPDLAADDRQAVMRAIDLLMNQTVFGSQVGQARSIQAKTALKQDPTQGTVTFDSSFPPPDLKGKSAGWVGVPGNMHVGVVDEDPYGPAHVVARLDHARSRRFMLPPLDGNRVLLSFAAAQALVD